VFNNPLLSKANDLIKPLFKSRILWIFLLCMIIYNINFHPIPNYDTVTARVLPWNIFEYHTLYLDKFADSPAFRMQLVPLGHEEHYLTISPITLPVLITPFYAIPYVMVKALNIDISLNNPTFVIISLIAEKIIASIITSLSVVILYLCLRKLISENHALLCSLVYAFGTSTWVISSQALWQHSMGELLLALIFLIILWIIEKESLSLYAFLGVVSALYALNRPPDAVFLIPVVLLVLLTKNFRKIAVYSGALAFSSSPFILYNLLNFGSLFGGYIANATLLQLSPAIPVAVLGYLVSPNRGIFFFSPVLIFSLVGFWVVLKNKVTLNLTIRRTVLLFSLCIPLNLLIFCSFPIWWGGESFGYRYLVDALPIFAVLLGFATEARGLLKSPMKSLVKYVFMLFVIWSIVVQVCGAFYYYYDWDMKTSQHESVNSNPARIWNITDMQIFYGVVMNPNPYDLLLYKLRENRGSSFNLTRAQ